MAINSLSAASYGFSGMVSGMDTQSLVEKMLSGTKGKITAAQQKKTQLGYKQTMYREIGTNLLALQKKYFDTSSANSLRLSGVFNNMKATSSSKYFSVTGSSNAQAGTTYIDKIMQLAKSAELKSGSQVSGEIAGVIDPSSINGIKTTITEMGNVTLTVSKRIVTKDNNNKETITTGDPFDTLALDVSKLAGMTDLDAEAEINRQIQAALGSSPSVKATCANGKFTFNAKDSDGNAAMVKLSGSAGAMKTFATDNKTEVSSAKTGELSVSLNTNAMRAHVDVALDGAASKAIYFDANVYNDGIVDNNGNTLTGANALVYSINQSLKKSFGETVKASLNSDGDITFKTMKKDPSDATGATYIEDKSRLIQFTAATTDDLGLLSLKSLGLANGAANKVNQKNTLEATMFKKKLSPDDGKFELSINGVDFRFTKETSLGAVIQTINNSNAGVKVSYSLNEDKFIMTSTVSGDGSEIKIEDKKGNLLNSMFDLANVGGSAGSGSGITGITVKGNSLNKKIDVATDTMADLGITEQAKFTVKMGGNSMEFTIDPTDSIQDLMDNMKSTIQQTLNPGGTEVDVIFDAASGRIKITGVNEPMTMEAGGTGSVIADDKAAAMKLFGTDEEIKFGATSRALTSGKELKTTADNTVATKDTKLSDVGITGTMTINIFDGTNTVPVTVPGDVGDLSMEGLRSYMESQLRDAYTAKNPGGDASKIKVGFADGKFSVSGFGADESGWTLDVDVNGTGNPLFDTTAIEGVAVDLNTAAQVIKSKSTNTLAECGIGELTFDIGGKSFVISDTTDMATAAANLQSFLQDPTNGPGFTGAQVIFDPTTSRFEISGVDQEANMRISGTGAGALFGTTSVDFKVAYTGDVSITGGQNAKFMLNGVEVERSSNSFTIDGLSFTLLETTTLKDASGNDKTDTTTGEKLYDGKQSINVIRDTTQLMETLVNFIEDYNKINKRIYELLTEAPSYKDYDPLTDEQKSAMSDKEVELWETKAKEGLLRSDDTLQSVQNALRSTLYKRPEGSSLALYDLGITTAAYDSTLSPGSLVLDADRLKAALEENPDAVRELFTSSGDGLGDLLNNAISYAANSSIASPGLLTQMAGATGKSDSTSKIYKQIREINLNLEDLADRYDSEYNRYWKQFNNMEQMIQQMNSQSSWLTQQMGG